VLSRFQAEGVPDRFTSPIAFFIGEHVERTIGLAVHEDLELASGGQVGAGDDGSRAFEFDGRGGAFFGGEFRAPGFLPGAGEGPACVFDGDALDGGGTDNITLVVSRVLAPDAPGAASPCC